MRLNLSLTEADGLLNQHLQHVPAGQRARELKQLACSALNMRPPVGGTQRAAPASVDRSAQSGRLAAQSPRESALDWDDILEELGIDL